MKRTLLFTVNILLLALISFSCGGFKTETPDGKVKASKTGGVYTVENGLLTVKYDTKYHTFSFLNKNREFFTSGRTKEKSKNRLKGYSAKVDVIDTASLFGNGKGLHIFVDNHRTYSLELYPDLPFIFISSKMINRLDTIEVVNKEQYLEGRLELGVPAEQAKVLAHDGLFFIDSVKTTYNWLTVTKTGTREGVLIGWLTNNRGSGIAGVKLDNGNLNVFAITEYGNMDLPPYSESEGEKLAVGYFENCLDGMEKYGDLTAKENDIKLTKTIPGGYCTWYRKKPRKTKFRGASNERDILVYVDFCEKNHIKDFGFDVIQLDDGWQIAKRDYSAYDPDGPYPNGFERIVNRIKRAGFTPGLWYTPFSWDDKSPVFAKDKQYFMKDFQKNNASHWWAGTFLDMSRPEARELVSKTTEKIVKEWGFDYLKLDALFSGMGVDHHYPALPYQYDNLDNRLILNREKSPVEAYRDGLKLIREAAGEDVYILGCNAPQNMRTLGASIGRVDGMRIGRDIGSKWDRLIHVATSASIQYFWHGRVWHNDPDCLILRDPLTLDMARMRASFIGIMGQINLVGEYLPALPEERLEVMKRSMPSHPYFVRPVDLFDNLPARIWQLSVVKNGIPFNILAVFNWDKDNSSEINVNIGEIFKDITGTYAGFDFWEKKFTRKIKGDFDVNLTPASCKVFAFKKISGKPAVVSTSRHLTQGLVDLEEEFWDTASNILSGKSRVIIDDPYELRIVVPGGKTVSAASVSDKNREAGVKIEFKQSGMELRAKITSGTTSNVEWNITFK